MSKKSVLLLGATGLVGRELLPLLLAEPGVEQVRVVGRRTTGVRSSRLEEHVLDLGAMAEHAEVFAVDQIFCALGTTIRIAGSQERFRVVDHDYPLEAARLGRAAGAHHYLLVGVVGADRNSRLFYNRVKGELETALLGLGYPSVSIARPSFLGGDRDDRRSGEEIAKKLSWLLPSAYKAIHPAAVARALVASARQDAPGVHILESGRMREEFEPR